MSSWGERMASVVSACGPRQAHPGLPYHRRLEKVKFGVPLDQVCKRDIPGPLLVMLLKLNKEGPFKKDVFRAPGHQGNMKKLIHFLQQGRLVNIDSFSVNTIASVLKKFLRKLPGGIFGPENESELFSVIKLKSENETLAVVQRVFNSLPTYSQHLLVLLFGTFRVIHSNSERAKTGMTAEALGVSVAPSFFHTCVSEGKIAKPEEVQKFKLATKITTFFIEHFGMRDLFGRENYEYYARLTGRILKVEDEWIFFTYPPLAFGDSNAARQSSPSEVTTAHEEGDEFRLRPKKDSGECCQTYRCRHGSSTIRRRDSDPSVDPTSITSVVTAAASTSALTDKTGGSLEIIPENCPLDPNGRLSISLDDHNVSSPSSCGSHQHCSHMQDFISQIGGRSKTLATCKSGDERKASTARLGPMRKSDPTSSTAATSESSHTCLPQVHQRQTERMRHRSEWFLSDPSGLVTVKCRPDRPSSLGRASAQPTFQTSSPQMLLRPPTLPTMSISPLSATSEGTSPIAGCCSASTFNVGTSPLVIRSLRQSQRSPIPLTSPTFRQQPARPSSNPRRISSPIFGPCASLTAVCDNSSFASNSPQRSIPAVSGSTAASLNSPFATQRLQEPAFCTPIGAALPPNLTSATPNTDVTCASMSSTSSGPSNLQSGNSTRLRRRLSDKDKERRLVMRSSSKRKNKENGESPFSASLSSLDKHGGSSGAVGGQGSAAQTGIAGTDSGPSSLGHEPPVAAPSRSRGVQLKRAGSADAGGSPVSSHIHSTRGNHPLLCRTGSQDTPHVESTTTTLKKTGSASAIISTPPLTRSLPRI